MGKMYYLVKDSEILNSIEISKDLKSIKFNYTSKNIFLQYKIEKALSMSKHCPYYLFLWSNEDYTISARGDFLEKFNVRFFLTKARNSELITNELYQSIQKDIKIVEEEHRKGLQQPSSQKSNEYVLEVGGIVGEDCPYLIRQNLEEQLGKIDLFNCLSTADGSEPARYQCTFAISSSASLEAIRQCTFFPYELTNIKIKDAVESLSEQKNVPPPTVSFLTPLFNSTRKAQVMKIKETLQKENLAPLPTMKMIDISVEEMAASAFGKGSHTAKKYIR